MMIDNPATVVMLIDRMESQLPIPAAPMGQLARVLGDQGVKINTESAVLTKRVFYLADMGSMSCEMTATRGAGAAHVVSLNHLRIGPDQPLYHDIWAYQRNRKRRLAESTQ